MNSVLNSLVLAHFFYGDFSKLTSGELIKILRDQIDQLNEAQGLGEYTLQRFTQWQNIQWGKNHRIIEWYGLEGTLKII